MCPRGNLGKELSGPSSRRTIISQPQPPADRILRSKPPNRLPIRRANYAKPSYHPSSRQYRLPQSPRRTQCGALCYNPRLGAFGRCDAVVTMEFIGLQMLVTLRQPEGTMLKGTVSEIEPGASLTLANGKLPTLFTPKEPSC